jgi:hypothetical protein
VIPLIPSLANIAGNRKTIVSHVYRLASPYGSSMGSLFVSVDVRQVYLIGLKLVCKIVIGNCNNTTIISTNALLSAPLAYKINF